MSLHKIPRRIPGFRAIAQDLGATPKDIARSLDVSLSTAYRWLKNDQAPRTACLSLFWLTRWGLSEIDADQHNLNRLHAGLVGALRQRVKHLELEVHELHAAQGRELVEVVEARRPELKQAEPAQRARACRAA